MSDLMRMAESVYESDALHNEGYNLWVSEQLPIEQIAVYARNYGAFTRSFPEVLSIMMMSTADIPARVEYAKTLFSEMGDGKLSGVHSVLFDNFFEELSNVLGRPGYLSRENLESAYPVLPTTEKLIDGEKKLYGGDNAEAAGAQVALEWQAYTMIRQLYEGARHYKHLWTREDDFHEACEFFYLHLASVEKEHKVESVRAAEQFDVDTDARKRIRAGFDKHLALFADFWNGIAAAIQLRPRMAV